MEGGVRVALLVEDSGLELYIRFQYSDELGLIANRSQLLGHNAAVLF